MTESTEDFKKRLEAEYSYRALGPIDVDGVRAYNKGHLVPASNVEEYGYLDANLVEKITADAEPSPATTAPLATTPPSSPPAAPGASAGTSSPAAAAAGSEKKD